MGRVILDSDDEDVGEQFEDEHGPAKIHPVPASSLNTRQGDPDERNRKPIGQIYAESVQPTPTSSRKRTRDDTALTPNTGTKKAKLRRISSAGLWTNDTFGSAGLDNKVDTIQVQRHDHAAVHRTQGGDTEMASSTMPRFQFEGDFACHNPLELFPEQSPTGQGSSTAMGWREIEQIPNDPCGRTTRDSTQGTSTLTFPSLEDHPTSQETQGVSEQAKNERLSLQLSGKVAENYLKEDAPQRSAPVVDIPNMAQTPKQALSRRNSPFADSPDELSRGGQGDQASPELHPPKAHTKTGGQGYLQNGKVETFANGQLQSHSHNDELLGSPNEAIEATRTKEPVTIKDVPDLSADDADAVRADLECSRSLQEQTVKRRRGRPRIAQESHAGENNDGEALYDKEEVPTNDDTANDHPTQPEEPELPAKKKARGRPKKTQGSSDPEPECPAQEDHPQPGEADKAQPRTTNNKVLRERDANTQCILADTADAGNGTVRTTPERDTKGEEHTVSGDIQTKGLPQSTPTKAAPTSPEQAPSHSPLNKGRVPFKVGLSKRARIEPLLRTVRKEV